MFQSISDHLTRRTKIVDIQEKIVFMLHLMNHSSIMLIYIIAYGKPLAGELNKLCGKICNIFLGHKSNVKRIWIIEVDLWSTIGVSNFAISQRLQNNMTWPMVPSLLHFKSSNSLWPEYDYWQKKCSLSVNYGNSVFL